jgi:NTE family protein
MPGSATVLGRAPKTAFVFAGGGSLGAVQVGMLQALTESGNSPDVVLGSSVGAINAAYFAGDPTVDGVARMRELWLNVRRRDVFPMNWRRLIGFLRRRDHLVRSDGLRRLIEHNLPFRRLEEARLPLLIVATDVLTGAPVSLARGLASEAILASSAIPGAFAAVEIDGRLLCDGAIASNTPVQAAVEAGAKRLIVLPTGFACAAERAPRGAIESALRAITLLTARQLTSDISRLPTSVGVHIVPAPCPNGVSPFDFSRAAVLMESAYENTRRWMDAGGLERCEVPASLPPHRHRSRERRRHREAAATLH